MPSIEVDFEEDGILKSHEEIECSWDEMHSYFGCVVNECTKLREENILPKFVILNRDSYPAILLFLAVADQERRKDKTWQPPTSLLGLDIVLDWDSDVPVKVLAGADIEFKVLRNLRERSCSEND